MATGWGFAWGYNYGGDDELLVGCVDAAPVSAGIALAAEVAGCATITSTPAIELGSITGVTG